MLNRGAPLDAQVRYPLQTDHVGLEILAETIMEANNISGMCLQLFPANRPV
jgi:hypothetical protein